MPDRFNPRGAPVPQDPNNYYDGWELTNRPAMFPFLAEYTNTNTGEKSGGMAWPSMVTEPLAAANRFLSPGGGFENLPTQQSQQDALTLLLTGYGGNALNPMAAIPTNSLGMFAGRRAATADLNALAKAEKLAAEGAGRDAIWNETGWFQGPDKQWRFEIDDSGSTYDPTRGATQVGHALSHDALKEAYPSVPGTRLTFSEPVGGGAYYANSGDPFVKERIGLGLYENSKDHSVLLHELQHKVQNDEGFAPGGNYRNDRDVYRRTSGEVESRNVERRMNMTAEERKATPPWLTQDVPDADQIVRLDASGPQMSLADWFGNATNALARGAVARNALAEGAMKAAQPNVAERSLLGKEGITPREALQPKRQRLDREFNSTFQKDGKTYVADGFIDDFNRAHVNWIGPEGLDPDLIDSTNYMAHAHNLTRKDLRDWRDQFLSEHPNVKQFTGFRQSGARAANGGDLTQTFNALFSDTGRPSLMGSAIAGAQDQNTPWWLQY